MGEDYRKEHFFVIDSDHLDQVRTRMYGYYLDETGITTQESFREKGSFEPDGCGAWVTVRRLADEIVVEQDACGSYGLYLFESGGYFALSNSFLYLVDYLKYRYPLTIDTDYADFYLLVDLCSVAYGRTMIREIRLLDRNASVHISLRDGKPEIRGKEPSLQKVELDSEEGMKILDRWYHRWTGMIRSITDRTSNVTVDLSGGFDSRITMMLLLCSGADLKKVNIDSFDDDRHTHREDFEIASRIAEHFGFRLNDESMLRMEREAFPVEKATSLSCAVRLGFHKQPNQLFGRIWEPRFRITGAGGEAIRKYWNRPVDDFLKERCERRIKDCPPEVMKRYQDAHERVLRESIVQIAKKYRITDLNAPELPQLMYLEERVRNHFGKDAVETWFVNDIKITPLLDQDLRSLRPDSDECPDWNLLMAVMLQRYCPELLLFPYDSGRSIDPDTLSCAKRIASAWPLEKKAWEGKPGREMSGTGDGACGEEAAAGEHPAGGAPASDAKAPDKAKAVPAGYRIEQWWRDLFESETFQTDLRAYTGAELVRKLRKETLTRRHNQLYHIYAAAAVVRMERAVWTSRDGHGCEGLCDRPKKMISPGMLRAERKITDISIWAEKHDLNHPKKILKKAVKR